MAVSTALQEVLWFKQFIKELFNINIVAPLILNDNTSTINLAKNEVEHSRTKHIDVRFHFIKHYLKNESIKLDYVKTTEQLSDILTKRMDNKTFKHLCNKLMFNG